MKLTGLRVVDLSQFLPGPLLAMMMADHGAEVIKIENPVSPEPSRRIGPIVDGQSVYFRNTQRGKKSVALDLKTEPARDVLLRLCDSADVLIESFRPGVADKLGFGAKTLIKRNPKLIYCSISAFGQSGSWRERPAHDLSVEALSGILSLGVDDRGAPFNPGVPASDVTSALTAFAAIGMALYRREKTGQGDVVDIAMYDSLLAWSTLGLEDVLGRDLAPEPRKTRIFGGAALYRPYRTKDGKFITLGGSEAKFAEALLTALGRPDLIEAAKKPPGPAQDPVRDFLAATFLTRTRDEWASWFEGKDVCFAPMLDMKEALDHPLAQERRMILKDARGYRHIGPPIKYEDEPATPAFDAPALGRDTESVLSGLGYAAKEIEAMEKAGAVKRGPP